MTSKHAQLWLNQHYDEVKHWLIVIIGFVLIVFALLSYADQNRLLDKVAVLTQQNKVLSQQNKKLNEQTSLTGDATQKVVLQNRAYIQCLSNIFANYTHNFVPITIDNLDSCTIQTDGTSGNTSLGTSSSAVDSQGSSPDNSTASKPAQSDTSPPAVTPTPTPTPAPKPNIISRVLHAIGL